MAGSPLGARAESLVNAKDPTYFIRRLQTGGPSRLGTLRSKFTVAENEDASEREADRVADQLQPEADFEHRLRMAQQGGNALPDNLRTYMEPRFGLDFGRVRMHTDAEAAGLSQSLEAQAFTHQNHIYFGAGKQPGTNHLTAHELTHVVQQCSAQQLGPSAHASVPSQRSAEISSHTANRSILQRRAEEDGGSADGESAPQPLTCPDAETLNQLEARYREIIQEGRSEGDDVAADNLEYFLAGSGIDRILPVPWLRDFDVVQDAEEKNEDRFVDSLNEKANTMSHAGRLSFNDYWDALIEASIFSELYYASGTSTLTSTGTFSLEMIEDVVNIGGHVDHHWHDPYDWNPGQSAYVPGFGDISDDDGIIMQRCRGARPFGMAADWRRQLSGHIEVGLIWNTRSLSWSGP